MWLNMHNAFIKLWHYLQYQKRNLFALTFESYKFNLNQTTCIEQPVSFTGCNLQQLLFIAFYGPGFNKFSINHRNYTRLDWYRENISLN